jgi:hypothetical protein
MSGYVTEIQYLVIASVIDVPVGLKAILGV